MTRSLLVAAVLLAGACGGGDPIETDSLGTWVLSIHTPECVEQSTGFTVVVTQPSATVLAATADGAFAGIECEVHEGTPLGGDHGGVSVVCQRPEPAEVLWVDLTDDGFTYSATASLNDGTCVQDYTDEVVVFERIRE